MRRLPLLLALALAACGRAPAGPELHQIRLVGASAALPFTAAAAEAVTRMRDRAIAPLAQAAGTGTGIARFCGGTGARHPDLAATTRPLTDIERAVCAAHGVGDVATVPFGWSALVLVTRPDTPPLPLSRAALYRALVGPARRWAAAGPGLPDLGIAILGPAPRPALADGLFDLLLVPGCRAAGGSCTRIAVRRDGLYQAKGADAQLVADETAARPGTIGILPWAYADRAARAGRLRVLPLDGVAPTARTIAAGRYPARLPLLLLIKTREVAAVPDLPALLALFADAMMPGGGFVDRGLIPLAPADARAGAARLRGFAA